MSDAIPVGRFSPSRGIWVDRTEKFVSITGTMEMYGSAASPQRASSVQSYINKVWNATFPDGYSVKCSIVVNYRTRDSQPSHVTQIEATTIMGPSHVSWGLQSKTMVLNATEGEITWNWTAAHEFGHIIGLKDQYEETIMSSLRGIFGGSRSTPPRPLYAGNLMAVERGILGSRNIADIATETSPGEYGFDDDDQVRAWVGAHLVSEITGLSTDSKVRAIKTLMGGWIDDNDVSAIVKICSSVKSAVESNTIRRLVNPSDMNSSRQRIKVRDALNAMP
ncbi:MAG: hypothetical protein KDA89_22565 [Planctomycetaceae bacterium]|nr:hypothetical protein [Planctomycetaceae bacterium]